MSSSQSPFFFTLQAVLEEPALGCLCQRLSCLRVFTHAAHCAFRVALPHPTPKFSKHVPPSGHLYLLSSACILLLADLSLTSCRPAHISLCPWKEGRKVGATKWKRAKNDIEKGHYKKAFPWLWLATNSVPNFSVANTERKIKTVTQFTKYMRWKTDQCLRSWTSLSL